jgi:hypothetical protein
MSSSIRARIRTITGDDLGEHEFTTTVRWEVGETVILGAGDQCRIYRIEWDDDTETAGTWIVEPAMV